MGPKVLVRLLVVLIVGTFALLGAGTVSAQSDPEPTTCPACCTSDETSGGGTWMPGRLGPGVLGPGRAVSARADTIAPIAAKTTRGRDGAAIKGQPYRAWFGKGRVVLPVLPQPRVR